MNAILEARPDTSPIERTAAALQQRLIGGWVRDAITAYLQAAQLLGMAGDSARLLLALQQGALPTAGLAPVYDLLLERYVQGVEDGRQPDLFEPEHEGALRARWIGFLQQLWPEDERAAWHRSVLQASVGLDDGIDRSTAALRLLAWAADVPVGTPEPFESGPGPEPALHRVDG